MRWANHQFDQHHVQAGSADGRMRKLKAVLGPGTWPEVMLRYVLGSSDPILRSNRASLAAGEPAPAPAIGLEMQATSAACICLPEMQAARAMVGN